MNRTHVTRMSLVVLAGLAAGLVTPSAVYAEPPGPPGSSYKTWTLKNESKEDANDLHLILFSVKDGVKVAEAVSKVRSAAFKDPPSGEGTSTIDYPSGSGTVPAGSADMVAIANEDSNVFLDLEKSHFTKDGAKIEGGGVGLIDSVWEWTLDEDALASLDLTNPESQGVVFFDSIRVFAGNDPANFRLEDESMPFLEPSGSLVYEAGGLTMAPGQTVSLQHLAQVYSDQYLLVVAQVRTEGETQQTMLASAHRPCLADFNHDGRLNIRDFIGFQQAWASRSPRGDFNGDGKYNIRDFIAYQQAFGAGCADV